MSILFELRDKPIGTMVIGEVERSEIAGRPDLRFRVTHYEKISRAVKPMVFYGETKVEAQAKAVAHDKKRKALHQKWRDNAKARRQNEKRKVENGK